MGFTRRYIVFLLLLASGMVSAVESPEINTARAQTNYMLNCQGCHLADGSGLPGSVPSMRDFVGSFLTIPGGREFLVQVPGSANSPLSNADLAELLNWILTTMSAEQLGQDFEFYTEAEVRQARAQVLIDVAEVRAGLVSRMSR
jgi:mono/diheme cytochrome c family protein